MNEETVKGKWQEIKGDIRSAWGKITADDLEKTKGDMEQVSGLIQQKYGSKKDEIKKKLADIYQRFDKKAHSDLKDMKDKAAEKADDFKDSVQSIVDKSSSSDQDS